jgi:hypothetical protein
VLLFSENPTAMILPSGWMTGHRELERAARRENENRVRLAARPDDLAVWLDGHSGAAVAGALSVPGQA